MHFRRSSSSSERSYRNSINITKKDEKRLKVRTLNDLNDPILTAVHEEQPFEQANDTFKNEENLKYSLDNLAAQGNLKDVFGNAITKPDISNPTRSRNERPLDTIKGFEYAIYGDPYLKDNLETPIYGWNVRPTFNYFPNFQNKNPYAAQSQVNPYGDNNGNINSNQNETKSVKPEMEQPVYKPTVTNPSGSKINYNVKKKRRFRLFRRSRD